ncbi:MAG: glutaredoxin [Myxococcales bacterium]|nr:glutaredoxin [Myxococcales bacterium]
MSISPVSQTPERPIHHPLASTKVETFHTETVRKVAESVAAHPVVVVGMAWNPHCPRAVRALEAAGHKVEYLEFGNYLTGWRERLAIKLWSGWPSYPQVFVKGQLIGGADQAEAAIKSGELTKLLG